MTLDLSLLPDGGVTWLDASGREMADDTWSSPGVRCLGVRLNGDAIDEIDERGERIVGATLVSVDEGSVRGMDGVFKVVVKKNFVGVVAQKPWQAMHGHPSWMGAGSSR